MAPNLVERVEQLARIKRFYFSSASEEKEGDMPRRATTRRSGTERATKKSSRNSTPATRTTSRGASHRSSHGKRKWSAGVNTESTYPDQGLFKKDAETIARSLASKKVSPKGPSSGMRMLTFYVNRAGKNLPQSRLQVLERAKELLHERIERSKGGTARRSSRSPKRGSARGTTRRRRSHS
jgi:Protein of unknown function (DUF3175)